jgi:hypothetical protein
LYFIAVLALFSSIYVYLGYSLISCLENIGFSASINILLSFKVNSLWSKSLIDKIFVVGSGLNHIDGGLTSIRLSYLHSVNLSASELAFDDSEQPIMESFFV